MFASFLYNRIIAKFNSNSSNIAYAYSTVLAYRYRFCSDDWLLLDFQHVSKKGLQTGNPKQTFLCLAS